MVLLALTISGYEQAKPILLPTIMGAWPALWRWMNFFYANRFSNFQGHDNMLSAAEFLLISVIDPELRLDHPIFATDGLLGFATVMWAYQLDRPRNDGDLISVVTTLERLTHTLSILLRSPLTNVQQFIRALGPDPAKAAKALFKPMFLAMYSGETWTRCYKMVVALHTIIHDRVPEFYQSLSTKRVVYDICYSLTYFTSLPIPESGPLPHVTECIEASLAFLSIYVVDTVISYPWVVYALNHRILPSLLRIAVHYDADLMERPLRLLLREIQLYSVYRPVYKALAQALASRTVVSLMGQITPTTDFFVRWNQFATSYNVQKHIRAEFEASVENSMVCSRQQGVLVSPRTTAYFSYLVNDSMASNRAFIIRERDRLLSTLPTLSPLVYYVNYSETMPPHFCVKPLSNFDASIFEPLPEVYPAVIPCIGVREGDHVLQVAFFSKEFGDAFGWFRGQELVS
ncbi:hypothetical protein DXG01_004616 [Tephrocybe rancida]|nr:hypothetical protein DXG01_004616 [Tephrocybe rancida]